MRDIEQHRNIFLKDRFFIVYNDRHTHGFYSYKGHILNRENNIVIDVVCGYKRGLSRGELHSYSILDNNFDFKLRYFIKDDYLKRMDFVL